MKPTPNPSLIKSTPTEDLENPALAQSDLTVEDNSIEDQPAENQLAQNELLESQSTQNQQQPNQQQPETTQPDSANKARLIRAVIIIFLVIAVAVGLWLASKPAPQQIQGMVEAETINVSTKIPSRVEKLMAEEGQKVVAGQVLGVLSSPEIEAKQQQAQGALQTAQALEQTALQGSQQENIATLKANWQNTQAQSHLAQVTYQRAQNLYQQGVISGQRRDEAQAAKQSATQLSEAAHQQYLRAARGSTPEQLSSAQAQVKIASAAVFEAKSLGQEMQLVAPAAGEVTQKFANIGELVPAGIPLYTLVDLENQWVTINLREDQFNQLSVGTVLYGSIPALNLDKVAFKVSHIAAQGTFASWKATRQSSGYDIRTFEIKLKATQAISNLRPGMSVLFDWPQTNK